MFLRKFITRRIAASLFVILLIAVLMPPEVEAHDDAPLQYPAPNAPTGTFLYVPLYWGDTFVNFNGKYKTTAYQKGFQYQAGYSNPTIILDFGRQLLADSGRWAIVTTDSPTGIHRSMTWAQNLAQDFIDGYDDNPGHPPAFVAIGTNNSNYNWVCGSNYGSYLWANAGSEWGAMVQRITAASRATVKSGNDIEAFDFGDWTPCGYGALMWFDAYEQQTSISNYDFGVNAWGQNNVLWTEDQIYEVVFGRLSAYAYPQVYCSGYLWATSWIPVKRDHTDIFFLGALSEDGYTGPKNCDVPSLYWDKSWNNLNDALTNPDPNYNYRGWPDSVLSQAIIYWPNP